MSELINKQLIDSETIKEQSVKSLIGLEATVEDLNTVAKLNLANGSGADSLQQKGCTASGDRSFAVGARTKATNGGAFASGANTEASGNRAHAEGEQTLAEGDYSHAEGKHTKALGSHSHAEGGAKAAGSYTIAEGNFSHAEGYITTASEMAAHAEGVKTTASGNSSHAEGTNTIAFGLGAHAEGKFTEAFGEGSHAEGARTQARGSASHAEGGSYGTEVLTIADGDFSHAEGRGTKACSVAAHAEGFNSRAYGEASHSEGKFSAAYGDFSHAEGRNSYAGGNFSHTEGSGWTNGDYAHAEGQSTWAHGRGSHAEGGHTDFLPTLIGEWKFRTWTELLGILPDDVDNMAYLVEFEIDFTSGSNNTAYTKLKLTTYNFEEDNVKLEYSNSSETIVAYTDQKWNSDYNTINITRQPETSNELLLNWLSENAYRLGVNKYTQALGDNSHAEGSGTYAEGKSSHSEGARTTASGNASHAQGADTKATADYAHAEGQGSLASGLGSHAENEWTVAEGTFSHAEGCFSKAMAERSHAEGSHTEAAGRWSHAEGLYTKTKGDGSHAQGSKSIAYGNVTFTAGVETIAVNANETVIGQYNIPTVSSKTTNRTYIGNWAPGVEYKAPQCVRYNDNFYLCKSKHTSAEPFDETKWTLFNGTTQSKNLLTIGNGTSDTNRSNAMTIDYAGNTQIAGQVSSSADKPVDVPQFRNSVLVSEVPTDLSKFTIGDIIFVLEV